MLHYKKHSLTMAFPFRVVLMGTIILYTVSFVKFLFADRPPSTKTFKWILHVTMHGCEWHNNANVTYGAPRGDFAILCTS